MSINGIPAAAKSDNSLILATARQAIEAWEAARDDQRIHSRDVEVSNAAYDARGFAFNDALAAIPSGGVPHNGCLYAVVPCDGISGMMKDARGEMTIVSVPMASIVAD